MYVFLCIILNQFSHLSKLSVFSPLRSPSMDDDILKTKKILFESHLRLVLLLTDKPFTRGRLIPSFSPLITQMDKRDAYKSTSNIYNQEIDPLEWRRDI